MTAIHGEMSNERKNPAHMLLKLSSMYSAIQLSLPRRGSIDYVYREFIYPQSGDRVLDLGCGPALYREKLQGISSYVGVDFNANHIAAAKKKHPNDEFHINDVLSFLNECEIKFTKILLMGVLHHLDDVLAKKVLSVASRKLEAHGKVFAMDPLFEKSQNPIARIMAQLDQGKHVRYTEGYRALANGTFSKISCFPRNDLLRIPYSHHFMICES